MNLTYRKLAMLEHDFIVREEAAKIDDYYSNPIDKDLEYRVRTLLNKVRQLPVL